MKLQGDCNEADGNEKARQRIMLMCFWQGKVRQPVWLTRFSLQEPLKQ